MNSFLLVSVLVLVIFLVTPIIPNANAFSVFSTSRSGLKGGSNKVSKYFDTIEEYYDYKQYEETEWIKKIKSNQPSKSDELFVTIYLVTSFSSIVIILLVAFIR